MAPLTSYLQTMNMLGYNPLTAIERALKGEAVYRFRDM